MLGKLLKYDFRSMWKQFSVIWPAAPKPLTWQSSSFSFSHRAARDSAISSPTSSRSTMVSPNFRYSITNPSPSKFYRKSLPRL